MTKAIVILDADGVFLSERPYWEAALRTALNMNRLESPASSDWDRFARAAIENVGIQRVTKRRGCNSNWDLAAVLTAGLRSAVRDRICAFLDARDWNNASQDWSSAAGNLWKPVANQADPLLSFGIDRSDEFYLGVQQEFQSTLGRNRSALSRNALSVSADEIRTTFADLHKEGFELAVCTGRPKAELLQPLEAFALTTFFDPRRLVTAGDVAEAECRLGVSSLGKPHWFSLVCAALGRRSAEEALVKGQIVCAPSNRVIYVGDGISDFRCTDGARSIGVAIDYVHIRSGVTHATEEMMIANAPFTLAIANSLKDLPRLVGLQSAGDKLC